MIRLRALCLSTSTSRIADVISDRVWGRVSDRGEIAHPLFLQIELQEVKRGTTVGVGESVDWAGSAPVARRVGCVIWAVDNLWISRGFCG